jgi:uncharacterized protein
VLADFHSKAETSPEIARFGGFEVIFRNAAENFEQTAADIGQTVHADVFDRVRRLTDATLERLRSHIEERARQGMPRDTHGDLHLDHVYFFPEKAEPENLAIIDCIEFNDRFRYADPVADIAFLIMDMKFHGRTDLAKAFGNAYFHCAQDRDGPDLLPFYTAYRSVIRAKVDGLKLREAEIDESEKIEALTRARAHWLLALSELEAPALKPCLILIGGLPGSGKSTLAKRLAASENFVVIRSDQVRKVMGAGVPGNELYTAPWTERTYAECLRRAEESIFQGLECRTDPEIARQRLAARSNDVSDADWTVYRDLVARWEAPSDQSRAMRREIVTDGSPDEAHRYALAALREEGLGGE